MLGSFTGAVALNRGALGAAMTKQFSGYMLEHLQKIKVP
jgi:hypothetical protein|tara:strand:+ start:4759 stop:4875 length:117 start_codon:yes stop_codon:yes gene_type:complete